MLTFSPRERRKRVDVAVVGDATFEQDEMFTVTLSDAVSATISDGSATGTITNDDPPPAQPGMYVDRKSTLQFREYESTSFSVLADGQSVSRFGYMFIADCQPEGTFLLGLTATSAVPSARTGRLRSTPREKGLKARDHGNLRRGWDFGVRLGARASGLH